MSMHLISHSLSDLGLGLFGQQWKETLATSLEVTVDQIGEWLADPAKMPTDLEARLEKIGRAHIDSISFMLGRMANTGLDRSSE